MLKSKLIVVANRIDIDITIEFKYQQAAGIKKYSLE